MTTTSSAPDQARALLPEPLRSAAAHGADALERVARQHYGAQGYRGVIARGKLDGTLLLDMLDAEGRRHQLKVNAAGEIVRGGGLIHTASERAAIVRERDRILRASRRARRFRRRWQFVRDVRLAVTRAKGRVRPSARSRALRARPATRRTLRATSAGDSAGPAGPPRPAARLLGGAR